MPRVFRSVFTHQRNRAKIRRKYVPQNTAMSHSRGSPRVVCEHAQVMPKRTRAQRDRRGTSDEVVRVLAHAFGFESAVDYGRANEAALSRLHVRYARAARRARALTKVNAFVARHTESPAPLRRSSSSNKQHAQEQQQAQASELFQAAASRMTAVAA